MYAPLKKYITIRKYTKKASPPLEEVETLASEIKN